MVSFDYKIKDPDGLHARPAGLLVKCAQKFSSEITVKNKENQADAKRMFAVMGLNIKKGDSVTFTVNGKSEQQDCAELKSFCQENI